MENGEYDRKTSILGFNYKANGSGVKDNDAELYKRITYMLIKTQVPVNCMGYNYLRYAIYLCVEDTSLLTKHITEVYEKLAIKYKTNIKSVERCIRHALKNACYRGAVKRINDFIKEEVYDKNSTLTNSEFINIITNGLLCEYNLII